ncbi:MAG: hypothetical protein OXI40_00155 [Chloroflexota bacterium]|nr:hypothetical protein [Chloroflexota bacterium]
MTRIAVSDNMLVDYSEDRWRLIQLDAAAVPSLLVEVKAGRSFRYDDDFGNRRALPPLGEVAPRDIGEVVLGWSEEEAAWQLGMTLSPELSFSHSSRWFELLRIDDPDQSRSQRTIQQIGLALADVLGKPFVASAPGDVMAEPEPIPLIDLPLDLGDWILEAGTEAGESELQFARDRRWIRARFRQIAWYGLLAAFYAWVSIASLIHELALPNAGTLIPDPSLLPYLGLGVSLLLLLMIALQVKQIIQEPDTLLISAGKRSLSALRGQGLRWQLDASEIQSVYASELVKKRGRQPVVFHGEINLQMIDGSFRRLLVEDDKRADALLPGCDAADEKNRPAGVSVLEPEAVATALQAAAVHVAVCLGNLPVWYDRRFK